MWNLSKTTKSAVSCLRTVRTALQKPTALGVSENGQFMAIGFDRGSISLYRGDISRDRSKNVKTLSGGISAITGIQFKQCGKIVQMFVCSDSGVLVYNLQYKDKEPKIVLDKTCEPTRCCALQKSTVGLSETHFMVGRDDVMAALGSKEADTINGDIFSGGLLLHYRWTRSMLCFRWRKIDNSMVSFAFTNNLQAE